MTTDQQLATTGDLSDRDKEVLEFTRLTWRYLGAKETAVLDRFGWTLTRYGQVLMHLIDQPAAEVYDAQLVRRLRRVRDERQAQRNARARGMAS